MPTTSETLGSYIPRRTPRFQSGNTIAPVNTMHPMTAEQFAPFDVQPPPEIQPPPDIQSTTPREIDTSIDDIQEVSSKQPRRAGIWLQSLAALIILVAFAAAVGVPFVVLRNVTTTAESTTPVMTSLTTATSTTTTTSSAGCVSPYVQDLFGNCVNILININNCGSIGNNCSSNYTSCSAGVCSQAPGIQLLNSNFVWTAAINGSVDDNYFSIALPCNITLYNTTVSSVFVTTNGVICLGACSSVYTETALPAAAFAGVTALPYWDDLYIYAGTSQGIYYAAQGNAPNRTLVFEFYTSHFGASSQYYHFQVLFFEARPNIVQYRYFDASDGGVTCTVGVQASSSGSFIQYSFDLANSVQQNTSLTFDTTLGTYTNSTF